MPPRFPCSAFSVPRVVTGPPVSFAGQPSALPLQHLLESYACRREDDHLSYGETGMPVPPFGCRFSAGTAPSWEAALGCGICRMPGLAVLLQGLALELCVSVRV